MFCSFLDLSFRFGVNRARCVNFSAQIYKNSVVRHSLFGVYWFLRSFMIVHRPGSQSSLIHQFPKKWKNFKKKEGFPLFFIHSRFVDIIKSGPDFFPRTGFYFIGLFENIHCTQVVATMLKIMRTTDNNFCTVKSNFQQH